MKKHIINLFSGFHKLNPILQILLAIAVGIITGLLLGEKAKHFKILGELFINMIQMIIVPLIFSSLAAVIMNTNDIKNMGIIGVKALLIFFVCTLMCVLLGMILTYYIEPGKGMVIHDASLAVAPAKATESFNVSAFILKMVPSNVMTAFAQGEVLQIILFTIFFSVCVNLIGKKGDSIIDVVMALNISMYKMINYILVLAPYGIFGFVTWLAGTQDGDMLKRILSLVLVVYLACILCIYGIIGILLLVWARINPIPFFRKMIPIKLLVFTTSSSTAALPLALKVSQDEMGCSKSTSSLVLSLGTAVNTNGSALYISIATLFIAQMYGVHLTMNNYIMIALLTTVLSLGIAGIPGASLVMLSIVLKSVGLPPEGIGIILGVDRFLDMARSVVNACGDMIAVLIVDRNNNTMDINKYYSK